MARRRRRRRRTSAHRLWGPRLGAIWWTETARKLQQGKVVQGERGMSTYHSLYGASADDDVIHEHDHHENPYGSSSNSYDNKKSGVSYTEQPGSSDGNGNGNNNNINNNYGYNDYSDEKPSDDDGGKAQVALRRRLNVAHALVHLLPVGVTAALVQLTLRHVYWADDGVWDSKWQTILQFPAKLHEILIVSSLSAMTLHIFRRMLVGRRGVPFGLLMGAYQVSSAEYVASEAFRVPLWRGLRGRNRGAGAGAHGALAVAGIALALGLVTLYANFVGPASAGAILPKLAWWRFGAFSAPLTPYVNLTRAAMYPQAIAAADLPAACRSGEIVGCPQSSFDVLNDWMLSWWEETQEYDVQSGQLDDPALADDYGAARRSVSTRISYTSSNYTSNYTSSACASTTLHATVLTLMDSFWNYVRSHPVGRLNGVKRPRFAIDSGMTPTYAPLVQVQCGTYDWSTVSQYPGLSLNVTVPALNNFSAPETDGYVQGAWWLPSSEWNFTAPLDDVTVRWVNASHLLNAQGGEPLRASLAAVVYVPSSDNGRGNGSVRQGREVVACVADARWAAAEVTYDPTASTFVVANVTSWVTATNLAGNETRTADARARWGIGEAIVIDPEWATLVDNSVNGQKGPSMVQDMLEDWTFSVPGGSSNFEGSNEGGKNPDYYVYGNMSNTVSAAIGVSLTDWLARSTQKVTGLSVANVSDSGGGNVSLTSLLGQRTRAPPHNVPWSALDGQTPVQLVFHRYGYGYGLTSGTTWFSIVTLLVHAALVVAFALHSTFFFFWRRHEGGGWTSSAWPDIGALVALAALSPQPKGELRGAGVKISRAATWMTALRVRERAENPERVELVMGDRGGTLGPDANMLKIGQAYR
ncbi:hypothetical protein GGR56DRAFT_695282 [Xylariaceae sp. FL0804]|nr:hypothetical protein GGR56DRAFT_695282 [Xylariaceae sp. FL0804]